MFAKMKLKGIDESASPKVEPAVEHGNTHTMTLPQNDGQIASSTYSLGGSAWSFLVG